MKAVLFDFGGTIDTDGIHWSEKFWMLYEQFGINVKKREFEQAFVEVENHLIIDPELRRARFRETLGKQLNQQFKMLRITDRDGLLNEMIKTCYEEVTQVIDDAKSTLIELQSRFKLGIVSNFYGNLEIVCKEFGLDKVFSTMIDSTVVGVRKPNPAIWSLALGNLGVQPETAWVVGDSYSNDIVPSKQLGCRTIWLKGKSWTTPASVDAADYTITKFEKVRSILL